MSPCAHGLLLWVLGLAVEPGSQVLHKLVFSLHHLLDSVRIYRAGCPLTKNLQQGGDVNVFGSWAWRVEELLAQEGLYRCGFPDREDPALSI